MLFPLDIVIPSVREPALVERIITAVQRSCDAARLEPASVTVVDDRPSRPDLTAVTQRLGVGLLAGSGRGPGAARNLGTARGSASWLLFVDDDVEVDVSTIAGVRSLIQRGDGASSYVAGLRPPEGVARWLQWAYRDQTMFSATAFAPPGRLPAHQVCSALLLLSRSDFEAVGGFPEVATWEDGILGLRLARRSGPPSLVERTHALSGIHWNVPSSWDAWLARQRAAGGRLAALRREVPEQDYEELIRALHVAGGTPRTWIKRAAAALPPAICARAVGRRPRRLAASAQFTRGFLDASAG